MKTTITPDKARELLRLNTKNRRRSKSLVKIYADDMRAGRWAYNGDPIRVSENNVLLDGQHRLAACIDADVPLVCELIEGLPDAIGPTIDTGRKRSAADALNIANGGGINATATAAIARQVLNYVLGYSANMRQSTPAVTELIAAHPDILNWSMIARYGENVVPQSALGTILFLGTRSVGMDNRARQFAEGTHSGVALAKGDARLACREAFIRARMRGASAKSVSPTWAMSVVAGAWNAFATGRSLLVCRPTTDAAGRPCTPDVIGGPPSGKGVESLRNAAAPRTAQPAAKLSRGGQ